MGVLTGRRGQARGPQQLHACSSDERSAETRVRASWATCAQLNTTCMAAALHAPQPAPQAHVSARTCGSGVPAGSRERSSAAFTTSAVASRCAGASSALSGDCARGWAGADRGHVSRLEAGGCYDGSQQVLLGSAVCSSKHAPMCSKLHSSDVHAPAPAAGMR